MPAAEVSQLLSQLERGEVQSAADLLPLVYGELRKLAAARLARERGPMTLQATALVHEAYLRLVSDGDDQFTNKWAGRRHFFGAASEAMRRIVVESARRRLSLKRGGDLSQEELHESRLIAPMGRDDAQLLAINEALDRLAEVDAQAAEIVKLRYFAGMTIDEVSNVLDSSARTVKRRWAYARVWLMDALQGVDFETD